MSVLSNMCLVHEAVDEQLFLLVSSSLYCYTDTRLRLSCAMSSTGKILSQLTALHLVFSG